jgi:prenyltransferase beta subunit
MGVEGVNNQVEKLIDLCLKFSFGHESMILECLDPFPRERCNNFVLDCLRLKGPA